MVLRESVDPEKAERERGGGGQGGGGREVKEEEEGEKGEEEEEEEAFAVGFSQFCSGHLFQASGQNDQRPTGWNFLWE